MATVQFPTVNANLIHKDGMCKGYSLAWLTKCKTKIPTSVNEMPTRSEASFRMLQYNWLFEDHQYGQSANSPNIAVLQTTRTNLITKGKHGKQFLAPKVRKFKKTARLIGQNLGAGYLIETKYHAMAAVNHGGNIVFFDPNDGQYEPMTGTEFIGFYSSHVKQNYSTSISEYYEIF